MEIVKGDFELDKGICIPCMSLGMDKLVKAPCPTPSNFLFFYPIGCSSLLSSPVSFSFLNQGKQPTSNRLARLFNYCLLLLGFRSLIFPSFWSTYFNLQYKTHPDPLEPLWSCFLRSFFAFCICTVQHHHTSFSHIQQHQHDAIDILGQWGALWMSRWSLCLQTLLWQRQVGYNPGLKKQLYDLHPSMCMQTTSDPLFWYDGREDTAAGSFTWT